MSAPPFTPDPSKGYPPPYHQGDIYGGIEPGFDNYHPPQPFTAIPQMMAQPQMVIIYAPQLGSHNARMTCTNCRADIQTKVEKKPSIVAWISAEVMSFFGLCCCFCVPFCIDSCMDTDHSCPNCGAHLGTHRAFN